MSHQPIVYTGSQHVVDPLWTGILFACLTFSSSFTVRAAEPLQTPTHVLTETPQDTYRSFRRAIATRDWAQEFTCYTRRLQDRQLYRILLLGLHLEFDMALFLQVEDALEQHGISDAELSEYWPNAKRRIIFMGEDASQLKKWESELRARVDRWKQEIRPRIQNPEELIRKLQPLIEQSAKQNPGSTVARELQTYSHHAFGRIRELQTDDDHALAAIRTKTLHGYFIASQPIARSAAGESPRASQQAGEFDIESHLVLVDPNSYTEIWHTAVQLQRLSEAIPKDRLAVIGMLSGNVAVELYQHLLDEEESEESLKEPDSNELRADDEAQESDWSGTGLRTVATAEVEFRRVAGKWLIDSIPYR